MHSLGWATRKVGAVLCLATCLQASALAGEATEKKGGEKRSEGAFFTASKRDPVFITADQMEMDRKKSVITYRGQVVAVQGEMTLKSDSLTAYYTSDMKEMKEVVAEGKVHVTQGDRVATGTKAVFSDKAQSVTLTGNPVVRQGNNQVSGARITFFIGDDRAVVEGGRERVKATIYPEDLQKREKQEAATGKRE